MANQNFRVKTGLEVGTGVTISAGIVTAVSFRGDGSALTGIAVTENVRTNSLVVSGISTFQGNVNFGDNVLDAINVTGRFISDLIPLSDDQYDLGTAGNKWKDIHIDGTAHLDQINSTGISTLGNTVVGGGTTQLIVNGDARVTGILTIGTSSVTFDGINNTITVGTAATISTSGFIGSGANLNSLNASNISSGTIPNARFSSSSNAYGTRTVSTSDPTGGSDGDVWYKV